MTNIFQSSANGPAPYVLIPAIEILDIRLIFQVACCTLIRLASRGALPSL